jgi:hypothetical protein
MRTQQEQQKKTLMLPSPPEKNKIKIWTPLVHATSLHWVEECFCLPVLFAIFGGV